MSSWGPTMPRLTAKIHPEDLQKDSCMVEKRRIPGVWSSQWNPNSPRSWPIVWVERGSSLVSTYSAKPQRTWWYLVFVPSQSHPYVTILLPYYLWTLGIANDSPKANGRPNQLSLLRSLFFLGAFIPRGALTSVGHLSVMLFVRL